MPALNWLGKDKIITYHQKVPFHFLDKKFSIGNSDNAIIHGDNLLALKSLLPKFQNKIKCIYIDPPYNTGNENWIYNDNVSDPRLQKWLGQVVGKEGEDLTRHDKWLCMMYPRLRLLQKLLANDGAIFISIDDNEQANLKLICDEIFGASNFVAECIVQSNSAKNNAKFISVTHEYLIIYAKNIDKLPTNWRVKKNNIDEFKKRCLRMVKDGFTTEEIHAELLTLTKYPRFFELDHYTYSDKKGPFRASDLTAPKSQNFYDILHPITKRPCKTGTRGWAYSQSEMQRLISEGRILFGEDETVIPRMKNYLYEDDTSIARSVLFFDTQASTKWIKANNFNFDFPKPVELLEYVLQIGADKNSIVLDAFAGSGTTAHAVINLNKQDGGSRRFILIELNDYAENITAERVKRVGGEFNFYEIGETLFDAEGFLNENLPREKIFEYVYFSETGKNFVPCAEKNLLGVDNDTAYYFFNGESLNHTTLAKIKTHARNYTIYAENCNLSEAELAEKNITFKQIPFDIIPA